MSNKVLHVSQLRGDGITARNGQEKRYNCPFCDDEKHHLYTNREKKLFHCFKCGAGGRLITRDQVLPMSVPDAVNFHSWVLDMMMAKKPTHTETPKPVVRSLPRSLPILGKHHWEDLESLRIRYCRYLMETRGLSREEIIENDIHGSVDREGIYAGMVIFPIGPSHDPHYFVCRRVGKGVKYINAPWPKKDTLFCPRSGHHGPMVICEGVFDSLRLSRIATAPALLGKEATSDQLRKLASIPLPFIIMLDKDAFSQAVKLKLNIQNMRETLSIPPFRIKIVEPPANGDPGSTDTDVLRRCLDAHLSELRGSS